MGFVQGTGKRALMAGKRYIRAGERYIRDPLHKISAGFKPFLDDSDLHIFNSIARCKDQTITVPSVHSNFHRTSPYYLG